MDNVTTLGHGQSWSSFQTEVGQATRQLTNDSPAWNFAVNHPITTGGVVAAGSLPALEAGADAGIAVSVGALAQGIGARYAAGKLIEAGVYTYLAQDQLTGTIPDVLNAAGNIDAKGVNAKDVGSLIWNTAKSFVPGAVSKSFGKVGETLGALSDITDFSTSVVKSVLPDHKKNK